MDKFLLSASPAVLVLLTTIAGAEAGTLSLTKECSQFSGEAGSVCTVTASNCPEIPAGSEIIYESAMAADGGIDSDIKINTPDGDIGYGHVVLDGATETGTVTFTGGSGALEKLEGELAVAPLEAPNYSWTGPYSY